MAEAKVTKCPACGALRDSLSAVCPDCGYDFKDVGVSQTLVSFTTKIEEYDLKISQTTLSKEGLSFGEIILWVLLFPIMFLIFIIKKIKAKNEDFAGIEQAKAEAIKNFPVPNSKADLVEFALFAADHVQRVSLLSALTASGLNKQRWNRIWIEKLGQIESKADIALRDDHEIMKKIKECTNTAHAQYEANEKSSWIAIGALAVVFIVIVILASIK